MIQINNISKTYFTSKKEPGLVGSFKSLFKREKLAVPALSNIKLEIQEGEFVGLIGPNGAGKTTLIKLMTGLLYPDRGGKLLVLGSNPFDKEESFLRKISLVSGQKNQLLWDLSAMDSFLLNKEIYKIPDDSFHSIVNELSVLLKVTDKLNVPVRKLSFGQRMKLELIAALLHTPKILFLDEPTVGLDLLAQKNIRNFLRDYNQKYGATVILTSHNLDDIKELCERVVFINHGTVIFDDSISNLKIDTRIFENKIVELTLNSDLDVQRLCQKISHITEVVGLKVKLLVQTNELSRLMSMLFTEFEIKDISVLENDIEEVIEKLMLEQKIS